MADGAADQRAGYVTSQVSGLPWPPPLLLAGCAGIAQVPTRRWASCGTAKVSTLLDVLLLKPRAVSQSAAQPADHRALMRGGWPAHSVAAAFFGLSSPSPGCRRVVD